MSLRFLLTTSRSTSLGTKSFRLRAIVTGAVVALMLAAAGLKLAGLLADPFIDLRTGWSRGWLGFAFGVDLVVVWVLLVGKEALPRFVLAFIVFAIFSVTQILRMFAGQADFGCFGSLSVGSHWTLLLDIAAAVSLIAMAWTAWCERPAEWRCQFSAISRRFAVMMVALPAMGFAAFDTDFEDRVRHIAQGQKPVVVEPVELKGLQAGGEYRFLVELVNRSSASIGTAGVESSCGCLSVVGPPSEIDAGETVTLTALVRPSRPGWFRQRMRVFLRSERQPFVVAEVFGFVQGKI